MAVALYARVSTTRQILVLDHGRVIEGGTHAELLSRRGFYAHLVERQMTSARERVTGTLVFNGTS